MTDSVARRFRKLREERGLSQGVLGDFLGVSQSMVSNIETNRENLTLDNAIKAATYFDVSLDFLACLTDERRAFNREKESGLTEDERLAASIAGRLQDPLLEGWIISGEALLELQHRPVARTPATNPQTQVARQ